MNFFDEFNHLSYAPFADTTSRASSEVVRIPLLKEQLTVTT